MVRSSLTFANLDWLFPVLCGVLVAAFLLWWSYRRRPRSSWVWACVALKGSGIGLLVVCLLEPLWSGQRARPGANLFAIVADTSQGMQIRDAGQAQSRSEFLQGLLHPDADGWQSAIEDNFQLRRFVFDTRLEPTSDFADLEFDGNASALSQALDGLRERFRGRPVAGILLLSDGNATDLAQVPGDLSGLPPVYPVVIGRAGGARDVALSSVKVAQTAFEDAPVTLQADARVIGFRGETVVATLSDASGTTLAEETARARRDDDILGYRFQFRPDPPGFSFYEIRVRLRSELEASQPPADTKEATLLNNARLVSVDRGTGPYRVLYVTGRPNWEYKFLNRALAEDPQMQLVALIRVARREARFDFRGRSGETSNPLFRGVENQSPEELERYDEPVIMRLNTRDESELRAGFPGVPEELYGYCAVILDDVEADYFTVDQMALLQRYVSERGGGLLMLGGMESFRHGGYDRTPVGEMLPVYLDQAGEGPVSGGVRMDLTREGRLAAWARLRTHEQEELARLQSMPPFHVLNPVGGIKPGASVLATAVDERNEDAPLLITQRFGRGRTAALTVGDLWRWGMQNPQARADMNRFWRQLLRWLVADVPERLEIDVADPAPGPGREVTLQVRVKDEGFQPVDDATVHVEVHRATAPGTNASGPAVLRLRADPAATEAGLYEARHVARHSGGYRATAWVTNALGEFEGRVETGWTADLQSAEFASLEPNVALLGAIARQTGGERVAADRLRQFARDLPARETPVMEPWQQPAWHTPWLFVLALACFAAEWGLRRWKGMA